MLLIANHAVLALNIGEELLVEEILVSPSGHVEVAIPYASIDVTAGIGADDNHITSLARSDQLVEHLACPLVAEPPLVGTHHPMKQVEDGILLLRIHLVALRQIDGISPMRLQHLAVDTIRHHLALRPPAKLCMRRHTKEAAGDK